MKNEILTPLIGKDGKYHFIYRTHNLINGKEYTGKHSTTDLNDGYYGSGIAIKNAVAKHGLENFAVEILSFHESEEEALIEESKIVNEIYKNRVDTYNQTIGGNGNIGDIVKTLLANKTISCPHCGKIGDNPGMYSNHIPYCENNPNRRERNKPKPYKKETKPRNVKIVECPHCGTEGRENIMKGRHFDYCKDNPNKKNRKAPSPYKYKLVICPHCGKEGYGPNMSRWHFDNCKLRPH